MAACDCCTLRQWFCAPAPPTVRERREEQKKSMQQVALTALDNQRVRTKSIVFEGVSISAYGLSAHGLVAMVSIFRNALLKSVPAGSG